MTLEKVRDRGHFCNLYFVCVCVCGCAGSSLLWGLFSLVVTSRGYSPDVAGGLLIGAASLAAGHGLQGTWALVVLVCGLRSLAHGLQSTGPVAGARGLRCSAARGAFWDQGSSLCLLHWQADSLPLSHQGSLILCPLTSQDVHVFSID